MTSSSSHRNWSLGAPRTYFFSRRIARERNANIQRIGVALEGASEGRLKGDASRFVNFAELANNWALRTLLGRQLSV